MSKRRPAARRNASATSLAEREAAVVAAERAIVDRSRTADVRDRALDARERLFEAKADASARSDAQLREANERLVVATVSAHAMAEVAERATAQMSYMAEHDFLTGLPNRSLSRDRLVQSMALAERHGVMVALLYVDVDQFKHVNDSLGHTVGDQLLQAIAKRLQACVRHSDTVSRHGGDEFIVLLTEVKVAGDAALIAAKIIEAMAEPMLIAEHRLYVTVSIGISLYPADGVDVEALIRNADTAMYHAKKTGRNNFQVFTPDMNDRAVARRSVEQALRDGLEQTSFVLHYQPKVNLETGAIVGAEALVRLQQVDRLVGPTEFVSIAEDCGLILPIGSWVLHEACRQAAAWRHAGLDISQIAVNVSSVEFHGREFLANVRAILDDTNLDPRHLELELTESGLIQDTENTAEILSALKGLGVQIAIDDFGTGYSSLSYLRRFPIDTLKIDQSFVQDIDGNAGNAIVSAIIAMGTSLKRRVVAEGIETREQLAFLRSRDCPEGQGYFLGRPMAAEAFAGLLTERSGADARRPGLSMNRPKSMTRAG